MRFRLSTILIAIVAIAILIGWMTDRSIQRHSEDFIVGRERAAARIYFRFSTAMGAIDSTNVERENDTQIALVRTVIDLCEYEQLYAESSYSLSIDAMTIAQTVLRIFKYESPEEFRAFAVTLYPFMTAAEQRVYRTENNIILTGFTLDERHYPELYNVDSAEFERLENFLRRAIEHHP